LFKLLEHILKGTATRLLCLTLDLRVVETIKSRQKIVVVEDLERNKALICKPFNAVLLNPHHIDADPDADPDSTYHPDADPDED
jgi:hypothetical protein